MDDYVSPSEAHDTPMKGPLAVLFINNRGGFSPRRVLTRLRRGRTRSPLQAETRSGPVDGISAGPGRGSGLLPQEARAWSRPL
jgi:hypothetical protein